jgi:type IV pilus assembly protein PilW
MNMFKVSLPAKEITLQLQRGLTIVELLIASFIGTIISLAIMSAVINSTTVSHETMKTIELTEHGRFTNHILKHDVMNAGYYGSLTDIPTGGAAPDPCDRTLIPKGVGAVPNNHPVRFPVQTFNDYAGGNISAECASLDIVTDTDVLVLRRASSIGATVAPINDAYNMQSTYNDFSIQKTGTFASFGLTDSRNEVAPIRQFKVHIYYVSSCPEVSCPEGESGPPVLKRYQLGDDIFEHVVIAEGVEQFQLEYGIDRSGNGVPNESAAGANDAYEDDPTDAEMQNIVSIRYRMIVRSPDDSDDYEDTNTYDLGLYGNVTGTTLGKDYKRKMYTGLFRVVNIASKREG